MFIHLWVYGQYKLFFTSFFFNIIFLLPDHVQLTDSLTFTYFLLWKYYYFSFYGNQSHRGVNGFDIYELEATT